MTINTKTFAEFRTDYKDKLGFVLLGAGAPLMDWVTGVSELLVQDCEAVTPVVSEAFTLS